MGRVSSCVCLTPTPSSVLSYPLVPALRLVRTKQGWVGKGHSVSGNCLERRGGGLLWEYVSALLRQDGGGWEMSGLQRLREAWAG